MAKRSMREREKKREVLVNKHQKRAAEIKQELREAYVALLDPSADHDKIYAKIESLQYEQEKNIPWNATRKRLRNRCQLTGRPRGVYRRFQLSRHMLRKYAMMAMIPGLKKASW